MNYTFILRLQDMMSGPLQRVSAVYSQSVSRWQGLTSRFQAGFARASQTVDQLRSKLMGLRSAGTSVDGLNQKLDALTKRRNLSVDTGEIRRLNREIEQTERRMNRLQTAGRRGGGGGESGGGMLGSLTRGAMPYLGAAALATGVSQFAQAGMDREQTKVAMGQYLGNQTEMRMAQMDQFANKTPFTNQQVYDSALTLSASGVSGDQLQTRQTFLGNMASASKKDFGDLSQAYGKILSKGFIDGGELHQEFGGTKLMDQLKKDLGVNGMQLFKLAEQKKISASQVTTSLENLSEGAYKGAMDKQSQTAGGKLSTMLGTAQTLIATWAEKLNKTMGKAFDFGTKMLEGIGPFFEKVTPLLMKLWDATEPLRILFGEVATAVWGLVTSLLGLAGDGGGANLFISVLAAGLKVASTLLLWVGRLVLWLVTGPIKWLTIGIGALMAAWRIFNIVVAMNPFTLWLSVLGVVVTAIVYAWDNIDGFREAIIRCWNVLKGMFSAVGPILKALVLPTPDNIAAAYNAIKTGWSQGQAKGDAAIKTDRAGRAAARAEAVAKKNGAPAGLGAGTGSAQAGAGAGSKDGVGKAAGLSSTVEGAKSTNITINLKSLIERMEVHATTMEGAMGNVESIVTDTLLRALNSGTAVAN